MIILHIRQTTSADAAIVSAILQEAADWLVKKEMPMWRADELSPERIAADVAGGFFQIAEKNGEPAGVIKFQLEDPLFWPDVPPEESAFVHRLAVKRKFAGGIVSSVLLRWAANETRCLGRPFLRLDCEVSRPRLRAFYECFGFRHHSDRIVGPYFVARYEYDVRKLDG